MNPQNIQQGDVTPEEAFASMGLATHLNEQMLIQQNPQPTEDASTEGADVQLEDGQGSGEDFNDIDAKLKEMEDRIMQKIDSIEGDDVAAEIEDIKNELKSLENQDE